MHLHVLPVRTAGAAENMATDFLLLQRYPDPAAARFRHYDWRGTAFTFGFGQKIAFVHEKLAADLPADLCRRPTGGGIVDHRNDWTYALVIPRGHDLEAARAVESYRAVHAALAAALVACGQPAVLKESCEPAPDADGDAPDEGAACTAAKGPGVCFARPELYDVLRPDTGGKIAGAAQKRTKEGLLFQGSVWRPAAPAVRDWDAFGEAFVTELARALGVEAEETPWPDFAEGEHEALTEQYASPEWIEAR